MTNRHMLHIGDSESIPGRLEEFALANSGEDAFEEIFTLLVARLLSEMVPDRSGGFGVQKSAQETAQRINSLLAEANKRWPGILLDQPSHNTFLPHTHQKADILFAVKREQPICKPNNEDILFLISEREGKDSRSQTIVRPGAKLDDCSMDKNGPRS